MTTGKCEKCGKETKAADPRWAVLCPEHWQALLRPPNEHPGTRPSRSVNDR